MKFRNIIPVGLFLILVMSCDPMNSYQQVVSNQSKHELKVVRYNRSTNNTPAKRIDSSVIKTRTEGVIYRSSGLGGPESSGCSGALVDSLVCYVQNNPVLIVKKDLNDSKNWTYSKTGKSSKGYNSQCKVIIGDNDIE